MPLQNRVTPHGEIIVHSARGLIMGNRGGRMHTPDKVLTASRWKSKAWISCRLAFKGWHREVMSPGSYTELFFLDEVTALAAGHRPCFECRRRDAEEFLSLWRALDPERGGARAGDFDRTVHEERVGVARAKRTFETDAAALPDGAMIDMQGEAWLRTGDALVRWSPSGYDAKCDYPARGSVRVLTPPGIVSILAAGYRPVIHDSALRLSDGGAPSSFRNRLD